MENSDRTVAIMVNYNNANDTKEAVQTLLLYNRPYINKIIIVDNSSTDNSIHILNKIDPNEEKVIILKSTINKGFAYGNNIGIQYALENLEFDFFLLINNDTIAGPIVNEFCNYYTSNKDKRIGILTGKIYYHKERKSDVIWYAGGYYNKTRNSGYHIGVDEKDDKNKYNEVKEITFVTGCLMFFSKDIIGKVGYLPEEYFLYLEDVDYSLKVMENQYKLIYIPSACIWHKVGSTTKSSINQAYYSNRNRIILGKKHLSKFNYLKFLFFLFLSRIVKTIISFIKLQPKNEFVGCLTGLRFECKRKIE